MTKKIEMKDIVELSKARGFVYPGSEIYGGLANSWDYGPYGSLLKENIKNAWIKEFVQKRDDMMLLDAGILMNPQVWVASGHVGSFSDPLVECKDCHTRHRADKLIEAKIEANPNCEVPNNWAGDKTPSDDLNVYTKNGHLECPNCKSKNFADVVRFNLMLKTQLGVNEDNSSLSYLRPETAQGIFVDFPNILRTSRRKLPFGVAQCGKAFRNEITPGNFIFRTREFEQIEIEYFCEPGTDENLFQTWLEEETRFFTEVLGFQKEKVRFVEIPKDGLPHYSKRAGDFEFEFAFGWGEISTLANRTNYDLTAHMTLSKQDLSYFDPFTNRKFIPYVIEPSIGLSRLVLAAITNAYNIEGEGEDTRTVLKFKPSLAPIKVGVLPVVKKISEDAKKVYKQLAEDFVCEYDEVGSIGKRYARFDEIGTPFCVTIDSENFNDGKVTVRYRDSMEQELVELSELNEFLRKKMK
ncbi:MAG: glycine--tRNA ligase [Candidatus Gracilibacteria bacterium]|nr:glycine--tRNA ligase [Candidatus Gracilibacteria bacterium]